MDGSPSLAMVTAGYQQIKRDSKTPSISLPQGNVIGGGIGWRGSQLKHKTLYAFPHEQKRGEDPAK